MNVFANGQWRPNYLDHTLPRGHVRVDVVRQVALVPAAGLYFVRQPKWSMLVSYLRAIGPINVARKVRSRLRESTRNDVWLSVGVGRVIEGGRGAVLFVLPAGAPGLERVVVPESLTYALSAEAERMISPGHFMPEDSVDGPTLMQDLGLRSLADLEGWDAHLDKGAIVTEPVWNSIAQLVAAPGDHFGALPYQPPPSPVLERFSSSDSRGTVPSYHCFGLGQYAKTQVIPNLGKHLGLECIHEINPLQIGPLSGNEGSDYDTSPLPRPGERVENAVVAGYHHTHGPTAVHLVERGARHVIIEKPLVTSKVDLDKLTRALHENPEAKVHPAFQRRYSPFNELLLQDLGPGPVSMAATVFEVPLPPHHWYRWPVSGGPVISNGCHWIDHFLFLNAFCGTARLRAHGLSSQTVLSIDLTNGASASISLRHEGSPRSGVRDHCTFWRKDSTAVIEDSSRYVSESGFRKLRRRRVHRYASYGRMYQEFGRRIAEDLAGDTTAQLRNSAETILDLAQLADDQR